MIAWTAGNVLATLQTESGAPVRLEQLTLAAARRRIERAVPLVELALDDEGRVGSSPHAQHRNYAATSRLRYVEHRENSSELAITQHDRESGITATTYLRQQAAENAIRIHTEIRNDGTAPHRLQYVSTLNCSGFSPTRVHFAHNSWMTEFRWQDIAVTDAGIVDIGPAHPGGASHNRFAVTSTGSWSTGDYLPMGGLENPDTAWAWQIEHNGAWHWELAGHAGDIRLGVSGPAGNEHQWNEILRPGGTFTTVPVSVAVSADGFHGALRELTRQRRAIRRPNQDNERLPVIFNDYMNCLNGDPTTEKLLPLIDAAATAGSEYFVIDAGWYAEAQQWWDTVGEWEPSKRRFPGGLKEITDRIHERDMIPGLWLEPEVIGVNSPAVDAYPPDAYFTRNGRRLAESGRYHLDFRHPAVIDRLDGVIDRLVGEFGVGYFKFDYNLNIGMGTDIAADSPGAGLLGHNRAYSAWLDGIFARYPDLVIENCSSGAMRIDYAQLSRMSIQSTSDQQDPVRNVTIAAAAPSAVTPEQAAVWAYPQPEYSDDLNALTLIAAMLGRIHLSGRIDRMDERQLAQVTAAVASYKQIRDQLPQAVPYWPIGLPGWNDDWTALTLRGLDATLVAAFRRGGEDTVTLPLPFLGDAVETHILHGTVAEPQWTDGRLRIRLAENPSAVLISLGPQ
ncbi:MAG TPA: glycoside hydrolase family 36 protein [Mycobacteriales bacterium]|nr:glycoside hydrolase family 36 protein [Mycobacteriales bacterium]